MKSAFRKTDQYRGLSSLGVGSDLPQPQPDRRGSGKIALLALLAVAVLGGAIYWLTRAPEEKLALRKDAGNLVNETLAETPLAGLGNVIAPENKPDSAVTMPPTEAGTLAGREVTGTIAAPMDFGQPAGAAGYAVPSSPEALQQATNPASPTRAIADMLGIGKETEQQPITFTQDYIKPAAEDETVKAGYMAGLARWLVSRYRPGTHGGALAVAPQSLNHECGATLAAQAPGGRAKLLRYAFHPAMLAALYNLYIDRFLDDLNEAADAKGLNDEQNRDFHRALAGSAALLARAVEGANNVPGLGQEIARIEQLTQKVVNSGSNLTAAVFEADSLREAGAGATRMAEADSRVEEASRSYRSAEEELARAQSELAAEIRKNSGPGLDEESLLFVASWIQRRKNTGEEAEAAIMKSVDLLHDLAARCAKIAGES